MTDGNVLKLLVATRGLQPEPVATAALEQVLQSPAAAAALTALAGQVCPALSPAAPLRWHGQVTSETDDSRPDLEGTDSAATRVVLEAKFEAELTAHQRNSTYLDRLPPGQPGLLLYLAPQDRLPVLWPQLLAGPGKQLQVPTVDPAHADALWLAHPLDDGRVLAVTSWATLLERLRQALLGPTDAAARSDLEQLSGLVTWRTRQQWTPVLPGDLPSRAGRQLALLARNLLLEAATQAATPGSRTRNGSSDSGPGRYIPLDTSPGGFTLWVGLWLNKWAEHGRSPLWLQVGPPPGSQLPALREALAQLAEPGGPGLFDGNNTILVPLLLAEGQELGKVTAQLVAQIRRVSDLVRPLLEQQPTTSPHAPLA